MPDRQFMRAIPKNATMKFVGGEETYVGLQALCRLIARQANVPPIYLDIWAWDKSHRSLDE
jgi:hypothetical protein